MADPQMAALLGMSDEEVGAVSESYADLVRGVREVEAARLQRVEPPQLDDEDGCMVVARLPVLTAETQPLLERWELAIRWWSANCHTGNSGRNFWHEID